MSMSSTNRNEQVKLLVTYLLRGTYCETWNEVEKAQNSEDTSYPIVYPVLKHGTLYAWEYIEDEYCDAVDYDPFWHIQDAMDLLSFYEDYTIKKDVFGHTVTVNGTQNHIGSAKLYTSETVGPLSIAICYTILLALQSVGITLLPEEKKGA